MKVFVSFQNSLWWLTRYIMLINWRADAKCCLWTEIPCFIYSKLSLLSHVRQHAAAPTHLRNLFRGGRKCGTHRFRIMIFRQNLRFKHNLTAYTKVDCFPSREIHIYLGMKCFSHFHPYHDRRTCFTVVPDYWLTAATKIMVNTRVDDCPRARNSNSQTLRLQISASAANQNPFDLVRTHLHKRRKGKT